MPNAYWIDRIPISLWRPILSPRARLVMKGAAHIAAKWAMGAVTATLAAISVAGIAIGFASTGSGDDQFFALATRSLTILAEMLG